MNKPDGGPAFPMSADPSVEFDRGMSLRDYFAAKALQAMLSNSTLINVKAEGGRRHADFHEDNIPMAYRFADAMIAERDK